MRQTHVALLAALNRQDINRSATIFPALSAFYEISLADMDWLILLLEESDIDFDTRVTRDLLQ